MAPEILGTVVEQEGQELVVDLKGEDLVEHSEDQGSVKDLENLSQAVVELSVEMGDRDLIKDLEDQELVAELEHPASSDGLEDLGDLSYPEGLEVLEEVVWLGHRVHEKGLADQVHKEREENQV